MAKQYDFLLNQFKLGMFKIIQPHIEYIEQKYGGFCILDLQEGGASDSDMRLYNFIGELLELQQKEQYKNG